MSLSKASTCAISMRLALAGALALRPGMLLLDEPTAMLDEATARRVRAAVLAVAETTGCTLVVVEHRMAPWLPYVDRLVVLSADGQVSADARPDTVLATQAADLAAAGLWLPPPHQLPTPEIPALAALSAVMGHP